jgi:hypothetical protein
MLLLPIFLAAKALAATTHTVTILDDNPDQRTLSTPASTAAGDIVTYLTLYPDGVNEDGQTRYGQVTGVSAEVTVTSFMEIPPSTTPTTTPSGTLTQSLPWHNGHHIEVLTVTDPDGTVHEVTRIDQQSTHITVSAATKPNGAIVLVSSGLSSSPTPTERSGTTTTVLAPAPTLSSAERSVTTTTVLAPASTQEKALGPVRRLPVCNNGTVTWTTIDPSCWPVYDMMIPIPPGVNDPVPEECAKKNVTQLKHFNVTIAHIPMRGTNMTQSKEHLDKSMEEERDELTSIFGGPKCSMVHELVDFGKCGGTSYVAEYRRIIQLKRGRKPWLLKHWWLIPAIMIPLLFICCVPLCLCRRRRRREATEKSKLQDPTTVVQQPVPVVVTGTGAANGTATGPAGTVAGNPAVVGSAGGPSSTGATATGSGSGTTVVPAGAATTTTGAPVGTAAPAQVVTTTTDTTKENPGTLRRAAEEGRAGRNVRFDGHPETATSTTTHPHQVDGTAELRTGSEVFDVGSMRGRKRNRGNEPL